VDAVDRHEEVPDIRFDGGDLDCGNGLLILIRKHMDPLAPGQVLEILSTDSTVEVDLPAWCRVTGNDLVSWTRRDNRRSFLVCKGSRSEREAAAAAAPAAASDPAADAGAASPAPASGGAAISAGRFERVEVRIPETLPAAAPVPALRPLSVMGVGSWPRPRWALGAIHDRLEGRLDEDAFQETADDAVRLCVSAQLAAGVDVVTDGEQRRDSYASFVGALLDNTQLIPLSDVAAMVDDPEKFAEELRALDVPAQEVRHPVVFGRLGRSRPLAVHELDFVRELTDAPAKVALPGPYLLTRTMWLDCLEESPYESREELGRDIVRVLREELCFLLAAGAALVQFDEPVLTEVVFSGAKKSRSFMCGALSEKGDPEAELDFAVSLMNELLDGVAGHRTAVHVCRGNWTKDESALLSGDYRALASYLRRVRAGTLFLELSTPRAGELAALAELDLSQRIGVGCVNPRSDRVETAEEIGRRVDAAIELFGAERLLLCSDCGFATFADNPVASAKIAAAKLQAMVEAAAAARERHDV